MIFYSLSGDITVLSCSLALFQEMNHLLYDHITERSK